MRFVVPRQVPMVKTVLDTVENQQLQFIGKVIDIPVVAQRQIPTVRTMHKTFRDSTVAVR